MSVLYDLNPECIDVQAPDAQNTTPLMVALDNSRIPAAAWLLSRGADVSLVDSRGRTAELREFEAYQEARFAQEAGVGRLS